MVIFYIYDSTFSGNILIVGRASFGKTYFTQNLAANRFFGKLVEWILYIESTSEREAEIESCFSCNVEFHYPKGIGKFENQLEDFKARSNTAKVNDHIYSFDEEDIVISGFGEKTKRNCYV